jgi:phosphoserine phosphatase RsbU/P
VGRTGNNGGDGEWQALLGRLGDLRASLRSPGADPDAIIEAILLELDQVSDQVSDLVRESDGGPAEQGTHVNDRERRLLRAVFGLLPVSVVLLEEDGRVRRVNRQAAEQLGVGSGYATGKPFTTFVAVHGRAAFQSQFAAVASYDGVRRLRVPLLRHGAEHDTPMAITQVTVPQEPEPVMVALMLPVEYADVPADRPGDLDWRELDRAVVAGTRRLDVLAAMTRTLLSDPRSGEPALLRRVARRLVADLADWVVIDLLDTGLRRAAVVGPDRVNDLRTASALADAMPVDASVVVEVTGEGRSALHARISDTGLLGADGDGVPFVTRMSVHSLVSVPITENGEVLGALTLARGAGRDQFDLLELGLLEEVGAHVALALGSEREYARQARMAETLQASLRPVSFPDVRGVDVAASYQEPAAGEAVGGEFLDLFDGIEGWLAAVGEVCGRGERGAAGSALVRHAIRLYSLTSAEPVEVLRRVGEVVRAQSGPEQAFTVAAAHVSWKGEELVVELASAGHQPPLVLHRDGLVRPVGGGGKPLGLNKPEIQQDTIRLSPGDLLLLYSSGAVDVRSRKGEVFGQDNLGDALIATAGRPAAAVVGEIERQIAAFTGEPSPIGLALLALRAENPSAENPSAENAS